MHPILAILAFLSASFVRRGNNPLTSFTIIIKQRGGIPFFLLRRLSGEDNKKKTLRLSRASVSDQNGSGRPFPPLLNQADRTLNTVWFHVDIHRSSVSSRIKGETENQPRPALPGDIKKKLKKQQRQQFRSESGKAASTGFRSIVRRRACLRRGRVPRCSRRAELTPRRVARRMPRIVDDPRSPAPPSRITTVASTATRQRA